MLQVANHVSSLCCESQETAVDGEPQLWRRPSHADRGTRRGQLTVRRHRRLSAGPDSTRSGLWIFRLYSAGFHWHAGRGARRLIPIHILQPGIEPSPFLDSNTPHDICTALQVSRASVRSIPSHRCARPARGALAHMIVLSTAKRASAMPAGCRRLGRRRVAGRSRGVRLSLLTLHAQPLCERLRTPDASPVHDQPARCAAAAPQLQASFSLAYSPADDQYLTRRSISKKMCIHRP